MAYVDWSIEGPFMVTCSCDWGCPCQFNSRPTGDYCHAVSAMEIRAGHFGDVRLDGLRWAALFAWPNAIHEGHGQCLRIVDERADDAQRRALLTILSGGESEPGATVFNVFASTMEKVHEPQFAPIEFEADVKAPRGSIRVPALIEARGEPILNPVTGAEHRVRVVLPEGFEYREAEYGNGSARTQGPLSMAWERGHSHFFNMHMTPYGPA